MVCFLFQYDQRRLSNLWVRSPVVPLRLKDASKVVGRHALLLRRGFHHFTHDPLIPTTTGAAPRGESSAPRRNRPPTMGPEPTKRYNGRSPDQTWTFWSHVSFPANSAS